MIEKILIVGRGSIGLRHLQLARKYFPNAEIKVLAHRLDGEVSEYSDGNFTKIEEAIQFLPQIAVIANPATLHLEVAQKLVEIGTHIIIEKPLSTSISGIDKLIETVMRVRTVVLVGYNLRFDSSLQEFRRLVHTGRIGKVLSVRSEVGQYLPSWRPGSDYRFGVSAKQSLGGGVLFELSHEIDYLRWIFGDFNWVKATLSRQSSLEIDVEDTAHLTFGFMQNQDQTQLIGTLNLDFIRHDNIRMCTVIGENGSLRWDGIRGEVSAFIEGSKDWVTIYERSTTITETYAEEWQKFLQGIQGIDSTAATIEDGKKVVELISAARQSSKSGAQVKVNSSSITDSD
jgi:predicted dehydrogenase